MSHSHFQKRFASMSCGVLIPTYNNAGTLLPLLEQVRMYCSDVVVVNDGSTDDTRALLESVEWPLELVHFEENKGKGMALQAGFEHARAMGLRHVVCLDSDGQHLPKDLPVFLDALEAQEGALIIGARDMEQENVPGGSSFGHQFSNFWYLVETGIKLPDTQSGYRLYPLEPLRKMRFFTGRYEFEIEVLVRAAWRGVPVTSVPIEVYYPPASERVSHFRPYVDFLRISLLNTVLVILAFLYGRPRIFLRKLKKKGFRDRLKREVLGTQDPPRKKALSIGFGVFMGIVPIWGYQLAAAIGLAYLFRLNKPIVILAANISLPPMIPLILYLSYVMGGLFLPATAAEVSLSTIDFQVVKAHFFQYLIGSMMLASVAGVLLGGLSYFLFLTRMNKKRIAA